MQFLNLPPNIKPFKLVIRRGAKYGGVSHHLGHDKSQIKHSLCLTVTFLSSLNFSCVSCWRVGKYSYLRRLPNKIQELNSTVFYLGMSMLHLKFPVKRRRKNSLVHDLVSLQNHGVVPFCSDNHHLNGQHESVPHKHKWLDGNKFEREHLYTFIKRSSIVDNNAHLTTSMMGAISPIQVCCTTIIVCVN